MVDADQERPSILLLRLHSGSVGPASRVDFGHLYKIIQYIISYYVYVLYPAKHVSIFGRHELAPPPTFAFGKIVLCGFKMKAEHSSIKKVI